MMKDEIEANAGSDRGEPEKKRAEPESRTGGLDRWNRDRLRRRVGGNRWRRVDLRKHAPGGRLSCGGRSSGGSANGCG
jgi:hypothetical protein